MRAQVAVYGLGNIGRRHVEGLRSVADSIVLTGVDPVEASRSLAAASWRDAGGEGVFSADGSGAAADIVILATSATGRLALLERALQAVRPKTVILEKVVFQQAGDFAVAAAALSEAGATAYANCPRRLWPLYQTLAAALVGKTDVALEVRGRAFGMACNAVHFIDLFQHLTGSPEVEGTDAEIDDVFPSKRGGYWECSGRLTFGGHAGSSLLISSVPADPEGVALRLRVDGVWWAVDEATGRVSDGAETLFDCGPLPYQSALTGPVVKDLIETGRCGLTPLAESARAHLALLSALEPAFHQHGVDASGGLPIT